MTDLNKDLVDDFDVDFGDLGDDFDSSFDSLEEDKLTLDKEEETSLQEEDSLPDNEELTLPEETSLSEEDSLPDDEELLLPDDEELTLPDDEEYTEPQNVVQPSNNELQHKDNDNNMILYIILDKKNPGLISYLRGNGLKVSYIFDVIDDARDELLIQTEKKRLVILETGTGRFTNMSTRKKLIDLIGICDEDTKIAIFYTDSVVYSEVSDSAEVEDRAVEWYKYRSTPDVLANLLGKRKENYVYDAGCGEDEEDIDFDSLMDFQGLPVKETGSMNIGGPAITLMDIANGLDNEAFSDSLLPGYKIKV